MDSLMDILVFLLPTFIHLVFGDVYFLNSDTKELVQSSQVISQVSAWVITYCLLKCERTEHCCKIGIKDLTVKPFKCYLISKLNSCAKNERMIKFSIFQNDKVSYSVFRGIIKIVKFQACNSNMQCFFPSINQHIIFCIETRRMYLKLSLNYHFKIYLYYWYKHIMSWVWANNIVYRSMNYN